MKIINNPTERAQRERDSAAQRESEFEAALAALAAQPEPEDFDAALALRERRARAKALHDLARERRVAADAKLAEAQEEARRKGIIAERARFLREGDRQAESWAKRYESAAAEIAAVLDEMWADECATERLNHDLKEIGEPELINARFRFHTRTGGRITSLRHAVELPRFADYGNHWPKPIPSARV